MKKNNQRIIYLGDMLCYILKKWKVLLIGCVLVGLMFGVMGIYKVQKKYDSASKDADKIEISVSGKDLENVEAALILERAIKNQREYNENSILMKIDPHNKIVCSLKYQLCVSDEIDPEVQTRKIEQGKKAYQNVLFDGKLYECIKNDLQSDLDTKYFRELISAETDGTGVIVYNIAADSKELGQAICNSLKKFLLEHEKKILKNYDGVSAKIDSEVFVTSVDLVLQTTQTNNHSSIQTLSTAYNTRLGEMSDNAKQYLALSKKAIENDNYEPGQPLYREAAGSGDISGSRKIYEAALYAIKRVVLFALILLFCLAIKYICSNTLVCTNDLEDMYGVSVIDSIFPNEKEKIKMISEKIIYLAKGSDKVVIIGSNLTDDINSNIVEEIKRIVVHYGIEVKIINDISNPEIFKVFKENSSVFLIERIGNSLYKRMNHLLHELFSFDIKILGAVVIK